MGIKEEIEILTKEIISTEELSKIEMRKTIFIILIFLLVSISVITIGWIIYRFFFWEPPIIPITNYVVNLSEIR